MKYGKRIKFSKPKGTFSPRSSRGQADATARQAVKRLNAWVKKIKV